MPETTPRRGRPTKFSTRLIEHARDYTKKCIESDKLPTIEGFATEIDVGVRTVYDWELVHKDFSHTMDRLRDAQRQLLVTNGLQGKYNSRFAMFLLKASHGMTEKEPLVEATQNSFMNISPELLADALKILEEKKG